MNYQTLLDKLQSLQGDEGCLDVECMGESYVVRYDETENAIELGCYMTYYNDACYEEDAPYTRTRYIGLWKTECTVKDIVRILSDIIFGLEVKEEMIIGIDWENCKFKENCKFNE